jgi:hypothetical protein
MKVTTATGIGLLIGLVAGLLATRGSTFPGASELSGMIQTYAWWIVVLSSLIPLVDYLKGMRTTITGSLLGHPLHQVAGFFMGISSGLGLFLILVAKLI